MITFILGIVVGAFMAAVLATAVSFCIDSEADDM